MPLLALQTYVSVLPVEWLETAANCMRLESKLSLLAMVLAHDSGPVQPLPTVKNAKYSTNLMLIVQFRCARQMCGSVRLSDMFT